ncbi:MAG TPA: signal peptide peptidase SppA [Azospirillaceae bacterium]|nr:signal peptide peptidase SppA [Azospirillaceae bacterium]
MLRFLVRFFAVIGLVLLVSLVGIAITVSRFIPDREATPEAIVLEFDLDQPLVEYAARNPALAAWFGREVSLRHIADALDRAQADPRVKGLIARFGSEGVGMAKAQELREAVERFRASGRFALAFAETFGEFGDGSRPYYVATRFDEIWLQPVGMVGLTGLASEVPFARKALEFLHLVPEIRHREEYKTAMNSLTETGFTPAHREMVESLLGDVSEQLVAGVAEGRRLDPAAVHALIDRSPLLDREALDGRLVDRIGYWDEMRDQALSRAGAEADTLDLIDYLDRVGPPHRNGPTIALIHGTGVIQRGENHASPLFGGIMGSASMEEAFDEAVKDKDVRAIVFRIDSPGGSAVASETIRRAVVRAKAAGKPVIVSMADTAGSGGYWIAMNADRIIAHPATLTGSIGVVAGKMVSTGLWDSLGISWEAVERGKNAGIWSSRQNYTESEFQRLDAILDDIYGAFTRNVAEARKLSLDGVKEIAKGRVWTGNQALALGLVDELGGFETALARARAAAGLAADAEITLTVYPKPRSVFEEVMEVALGVSEVRALSSVLTDMKPALQILNNFGIIRDHIILGMPPTGLADP